MNERHAPSDGIRAETESPRSEALRSSDAGPPIDAGRISKTLPIDASANRLWLIITAIGATWLDISQIKIICDPSRGVFWLWVLISFALTNCLLLKHDVFKTRFLVNVVMIANVFWAVISLIMARSFRDTFFGQGIFPPGSFNPVSLSVWNNYDFLRLVSFVLGVLLSIIACEKAFKSGRVTPWWYGLITPRNVVRIRQITHEIDEWGKDIPLIGGSFKTLTGVWKALRRFKTDGKPVRVYDVGVIAGGSVGGLEFGAPNRWTTAGAGSPPPAIFCVAEDRRISSARSRQE